MTLDLIKYRETSQSQSQSLQELKRELERSIRAGEWKTVIISRDTEGNVVGMFFPKDDKELRDRGNIAACELIPDVPPPNADQEKTLFAHLTLDSSGELAVYSSQDSLFRPADDSQIGQLVRNFFSGPGFQTR